MGSVPKGFPRFGNHVCDITFLIHFYNNINNNNNNNHNDNHNDNFCPAMLFTLIFKNKMINKIQPIFSINYFCNTNLGWGPGIPMRVTLLRSSTLKYGGPFIECCLVCFVCLLFLGFCCLFLFWGFCVLLFWGYCFVFFGVFFWGVGGVFFWFVGLFLGWWVRLWWWWWLLFGGMWGWVLGDFLGDSYFF